MKPLYKLSSEQVKKLHTSLIEQFGGRDGLRDSGLLESALLTPFQTFGGQLCYPSVQAQAAQLGFGLIRNHPFVDGNKRIGAHVMLSFLALNGIVLTYTQQELINVSLSVASGETSSPELLLWILEHQTPLKK